MMKLKSSTSSQTVKQIEVVKEVVSPEVSKVNSPVMNKNQGDQAQLEKEKKDIKKRNLLFLYID